MSVDGSVYNVQMVEKELMISSLQRRADSESSAVGADAGAAASHEVEEQSVRDFSSRAPLIDNLQRELSLAQVYSHLLLPPCFIFTVTRFFRCRFEDSLLHDDRSTV